jgi:DNA-binding PadR family transcriptional regulator
MSKLENNLIQELKRGTIALSVLIKLEEAKYGYALVQELEGDGMAIEQSTLYPLLRRLESQELLESDWMVEGKRPRKYYKTTQKGKKIRQRLITEWSSLSESVALMIGRIEK